jgi:hypothetical protein
MEFFGSHQVPLVVALALAIVAVVALVGLKSRPASVAVGVVVALAQIGWWGLSSHQLFTQFERREERTEKDEFGDEVKKVVMLPDFQPGLGDLCGPLAGAALGGIVAAIVVGRMRKSPA